VFALFEFDHVVAAPLRPDVGQAVVDVALVREHAHPRHLIILDLDVMVVGGIVGVSEADKATGLDDKKTAFCTVIVTAVALILSYCPYSTVVIWTSEPYTWLEISANLSHTLCFSTGGRQ